MSVTRCHAKPAISAGCPGCRPCLSMCRMRAPGFEIPYDTTGQVEAVRTVQEEDLVKVLQRARARVCVCVCVCVYRGCLGVFLTVAHICNAAPLSSHIHITHPGCHKTMSDQQAHPHHWACLSGAAHLPHWLPYCTCLGACRCAECIDKTMRSRVDRMPL